MVSEEALQKLFDELRRQMLATETIKKTINEIPDLNLINVRFKGTANSLMNNILAEQLNAADYIYQILKAGNDNDLDGIIDDFRGGDDGNL